MAEFRKQLEQQIGVSLDGCNLSDFLIRWRFLSVHENADGTKSLFFTPHSGSTVFFGNLSEACTKQDIQHDLEKANRAWKNLPVRLKTGKGFCYAFVDFPTRGDARRAVRLFDDKAVFKSTSISADIEAIGQRKRPHGNTDLARSTYWNMANTARAFYGSSSSGPHASPSTQETKSKHVKNTWSDGKVTVYLGNLRQTVTKQQISTALAYVRPQWDTLPIRLNVRRGWTHAFIGLLYFYFFV
ncbi:hypothetical protein RFI_27088 [Reticulomyxa filosa]|uniref:RRM domain-containing protein n=1 Tax=Reticulomyxa filosa TaxID=46433 RepID=X6M9H5_RETFI|nr:hypothetical protein RFI_27088 [Reticulomyxa filosa]|eukprot:ETO10291.1 hypothetical protein RFI_27088 [Reticulomyxa filosa]